MNKILISTILIVAMTISVVFFKTGISLDKTLVVGVAPMFPPFSYVGGKHGNEIIGFDIEIANRIAKERGNKIKIQTMYFNQLLPAIKNGEIDMAISIISITDEQKELVDFSDPYYEGSLSILVCNDDIESFANIHTKEEFGKNKKLASLSGTIGMTVARRIAGDSAVVESRLWDTAILELIHGNVDAVIITEGAGKMFAAQYDNLSILPIAFQKVDYAVAVKKGNNRLLNDINKTIKKLKDSGEHERLVAEHIDSYQK